jgi:hypothetical protein
MKKLIVCVIAVLLLAFVVPAAAKNPKVPTGEKIGMVTGSIEYPANTPFHFSPGWMFDPPDDIPMFPPYSFTLEMDGVQVPESFILRSADPHREYPIQWGWVFNFPEGLSGVHTFTGWWCNGLGCHPEELTVTFK